MDESLAVVRRVPWVSDVRHYDELGSTNAEAARLAASGAPGGTVVIARRQTAGRGRFGRPWWSEPGSSLTASWIVRPDLPVERWPVLSLATGLAVAAAVESSCGILVSLKWPNDLLCGGAKLAGILAEAHPPDTVVIGLGVNLRGGIPPELGASATSIEAAGGREVAEAALLADVLQRFGDELAGVAGVVARYRERCDTLGREVRVERAGATVVGVARDVDQRGALVVETDDDVVTIAAGDAVHLRRPRR